MDPHAPPPPLPEAPHRATAPAHRGPPDTYRPLSGLCLSAFILALVLAILAVLSLWAGSLLPLVLAIAGLTTVDSRLRRGRALAWWALGISLLAGAYGLFETRSMHALAEHLDGGVLAAMRAKGTEAERDALLEPWLSPEADPGALRRVQDRFADAVAKFGPAQGLDLPSVWAGAMFAFLPPSRVAAVDDGVGKPPSLGSAFWGEVRFEKASLHMAVVVGKEGDTQGLQEAMEKLTKDSGQFSLPVRVVRDVRFFAPVDALPKAPPAPPAPAPDPVEGR